jgi:hypothetical protein
MYDPPPPPGPHVFTFTYLYPPFYASLLHLLPFDSLVVTLFLIVCGVAALAWGIACIARARVLWVAPLVVFYPYTIIMLLLGSVTPLVWGLSAAALVLPANIGAFALGIAAGIKITPIWPLAIVFVREKAWKGTVAVALFGLGVCVAALGIGGFGSEMRMWLDHVAPTLAQGQFTVADSKFGPLEGPLFDWVAGGNFSPVFAPLFWLVEDRTGPLPPWASAYLTIASTLVPLLAVWLTRKLPVREQAAYVLAAATVASPIFRPPYSPLLFPALAFVWRRTRFAQVLTVD